MFRRLGALAGAVVASLAFAASAHAATTPIMKPIPYYSCGPVVASWTPSTPSPGWTIVGYRVDVGDLTTGTSKTLYTGALSKSLEPLINGHHYVARVRAMEYRPGYPIHYSGSSGRTFKKLCLQIPPYLLRQYVAIDPWPWDDCPQCQLDLEDLRVDDPVILKAIRASV